MGINAELRMVYCLLFSPRQYSFPQIVVSMMLHILSSSFNNVPWWCIWDSKFCYWCVLGWWQYPTRWDPAILYSGLVFSSRTSRVYTSDFTVPKIVLYIEQRGYGADSRYTFYTSFSCDISYVHVLSSCKHFVYDFVFAPFS